eukprot:m.283932 g.283932  ORF g.283932 m.283932 type:complete len:315 (-) comp16190_c0_seq9:111-1055(-)
MPRQSPVKQVGQARSAATKVAGKVGAKVIEEVPVDQCLNKYFSVPEPWWLRVTLPLAEYLLLLTVLLLFLEVAPQDIPAKCSNKLQETCLRLYNVDRNGEFDAGFLQEACGTLRMNCWRGGIKAVIYNGEEMTDADLYYKAGVYDRVFNLLGEGTAAQSDLCQCMLTNNGTEQYPRSPNAARADTNYFCDAIIASQNLGTVGLILSALVIALKSKLEQLVEMDSVSDFQVAVMHLMIDAFWFAWSLAVVIETVDYATEKACLCAGWALDSRRNLQYLHRHPCVDSAVPRTGRGEPRRKCRGPNSALPFSSASKG